MSRHLYVLWRRTALWSNSSWGARAVFWGGCFTAAWVAGEYTMKLTNQAAFDPKHTAKIAQLKTTEESVQTDVAKAHLQRLLTDIEKGDDQKRSWKPW